MTYTETITRYPLAWPLGKTRTPSSQRERSPFRIKSIWKAAKEMHAQLERMGATDIILSTNLTLRNAVSQSARRSTAKRIARSARLDRGRFRKRIHSYIAI